MFKIKFTITYDGSNFFGWQRQKKQSSIQEVIENTLFRILQIETKIIGAGRTDRGVHAKGQVACCYVPENTNLGRLKKALNALLPADIRILKLEKAEEDFHPRYSAVGKIYKYQIYTKKELDPFKRHTSYHHPYPLDVEEMKKSIPAFLGTKDFSSFANEVGKNSKTPNPIKTIYSITSDITNEGITLTFHGSGFLYKMVRNITGALIDAGEGKITLKELEEILSKRTKNTSLRQAPAHGLCLDSVLY